MDVYALASLAFEFGTDPPGADLDNRKLAPQAAWIHEQFMPE